jgi:hypothetical protein
MLLLMAAASMIGHKYDLSIDMARDVLWRGFFQPSIPCDARTAFLEFRLLQNLHRKMCLADGRTLLMARTSNGNVSSRGHSQLNVYRCEANLRKAILSVEIVEKNRYAIRHCFKINLMLV